MLLQDWLEYPETVFSGSMSLGFFVLVRRIRLVEALHVRCASPLG